MHVRAKSNHRECTSIACHLVNLGSLVDGDLHPISFADLPKVQCVQPFFRRQPFKRSIGLQPHNPCLYFGNERGVGLISAYCTHFHMCGASCVAMTGCANNQMHIDVSRLSSLLPRHPHAGSLDYVA